LTRGNGYRYTRPVKDATKEGSLAGRIEVRSILKVSKQRAHALETHPDFPAPVDVLEDGQGRPLPVWNRREIEEFDEQRSSAAGRPPSPVAAD
jgi:hypothetical protein